MSGRLVTVYNRVQTSGSDDGTYIGQNVMPSDVRWRCAVVCGYSSPWQPSPGLGSQFAMIQLHVNEASVWETPVISPISGEFLTVLPWGDGLRFSAREKVGWNLFFLGAQSVWSSTFIGARD